MFSRVSSSTQGLVVNVALAAVFAASAVGAQAAEVWVQTGVDVFSSDADPFRGQGVTTDGAQWYFSGTNALERAALDSYAPLQRQTPAIAPALANPSAQAYKGLNHRNVSMTLVHRAS